MQSKDWRLVQRVGVDFCLLVPFTIIMVVPLSPPGHAFAFSLMNRCIPNAIPSPFTAERQLSASRAQPLPRLAAA